MNLLKCCLSTFIFLVLLISCTHHKPAELSENPNLVTLNINEDDNKWEVDFQEVYENIEFVKLETRKECLIGAILKVEVTKDRIYVLDSQLAKSLFVFNRSGEYLFKLASTGRGPGEFMYPADFWINENSGEILILSGSNSKLMFYTHDGVLRKEKMLKVSSSNISSTSDNSIFVYTCSSDAANQNQIIRFNEKGKIIKCYLPYKSTNKQYPVCHKPSNSSFYKIVGQREILFTLPFEDYIYSISSGGIMPKYYIDFNNAKMPAAYFKGIKASDNLLDLFYELPYAYGIHNVFENDSLLTFSYYLKNKRQVFYYKTTGRLLLCRKIIPDLATYNILNVSNDYMVGQIEPTYLMKWKGHIEEILKENRNFKIYDIEQELLTLAKGVTENDNPVITFIKLKY